VLSTVAFHSCMSGIHGSRGFWMLGHVYFMVFDN